MGSRTRAGSDGRPVPSLLCGGVEAFRGPGRQTGHLPLRALCVVRARSGGQGTPRSGSPTLGTPPPAWGCMMPFAEGGSHTFKHPAHQASILRTQSLELTQGG